MKTLFNALLEYNNTPQSFNPHLCLDVNTGKYTVVNHFKKESIVKLFKLKIIK